MIKNIILDFGKVLVTYDFHATVDSWGMTPQDRADFNASILSREWNLRIDRGDKSFLEYVEELSALYPHLSKWFRKFYDEYDSFITGEMPGMRELLTELKAKGMKLYGLSNWSETVYPILKKYPIFQLLDGMVISCEIKMVKPEPGIYLHLLEKYHLKADECLFLDDKEENVLGARAVGMHSEVFTDADPRGIFFPKYLAGSAENDNFAASRKSDVENV